VSPPQKGPTALTSSHHTPHRPSRIVSLGQPVKLEPSLKDMPPSSAELAAQQTLKGAQTLADSIEQDAHARAADIVAAAQEIEMVAQAKAQALLAEVEAQMADQLESARAEGYEAGHAAGMAQALADCNDQLQTAALIANAAYEQQRRVLQHLSPQAIALMQAALAKVLGQQWAQNAEELVALAYDQAVEALHLSGRMTLVIHPSHLARLKTSNRLPLEGDASLAGTTRLRLMGDSLLGPDELFLTSEEGQFDLSVARAAARVLEDATAQPDRSPSV
jgi:flagellar biosynthesis/type III secretory pathway protein FliH